MPMWYGLGTAGLDMLLPLLRNWYILASTGFTNRKINTYANESASDKKSRSANNISSIFVRNSLQKILRESRLSIRLLSIVL